MDTYEFPLHVHVDGSQEAVELAMAIMLGDHGFPCELDKIVEAADGPQRAEKPEVYATHDPTDRWDRLATFGLPNREAAVTYVTQLLEELTQFPGTVIELEQPLWVLSDEGSRIAERIDQALPISGTEITTEPGRTDPIEIHLAIQPDASMEITAETVLQAAARAGIPLGGVFRDGKGVLWTNSFETCAGAHSLHVLGDWRHKLWLELLKMGFRKAKVSGMAEAILGVWKIGA